MVEQPTTNHSSSSVELDKNQHQPSGTEENAETHQVPVIDLSNPNKSEIIAAISRACKTFGFFQIINHRIPNSVIEDFRSAMKDFFHMPQSIKDTLRRNECNARGYFDDELTKQRRDWKECLDVGVPGSRDWSLPDEDCGMCD